MADKIQTEYETPLSLNGDGIVVASKKVWWSGDETEPSGTWLTVGVYGKKGEIYRRDEEITHQFESYAKQKHEQAVGRVENCGSLEKVSSAIEEIFRPVNN